VVLRDSLRLLFVLGHLEAGHVALRCLVVVAPVAP
jgi:hypothetical protein